MYVFFWFTVKSIEIGVFAKCCYFSLTEVTGIRKIHSFLTVDKHAEDGREFHFGTNITRSIIIKGTKNGVIRLNLGRKQPI